jgi:hypothetical protein
VDEANPSPSKVPVTGTDNGAAGNPITGMLCPITGTAAPDPDASNPNPKSKSSPTAPARVEEPVVSCDDDDEEEEAKEEEPCTPTPAKPKHT